MNKNTRRKRLLLRVSRQGPFNRREPLVDVLDDVGEVIYSKFNRRVDYVRRKVYFADKTGSIKYHRLWLRAIEWVARRDVEHALSDCCGWGNLDPYHDPYEFVAGGPPPRPLNLPRLDEENGVGDG